MVFEKKKIRIETLSEYLEEVRKSLHLSVEEVAQKTGIKIGFLQSLEDGKFKSLPADVYVYGFLKQLSMLYRIEADVLISQYKKERNIELQVQKQFPGTKSWLKKFFNKIIITPKYIGIGVGSIFVVLTLVYVIWQVLSINKTPNLEIYQPSDRQVVKDSFVNVVGKTDSGMTVSVNNQNIFVDSQGNFKAQLGMTPGPKEIVITSTNKFDKTVTKKISVVGESQITNVPSSLQLKLEFSADVTLSFVLDDSLEQTLMFHAGDLKFLSAAQKIIISTSDAGATKVTLNGRLMGALGRPGEKLTSIPFSAEPTPTGNAIK